MLDPPLEAVDVDVLLDVVVLLGGGKIKLELVVEDVVDVVLLVVLLVEDEDVVEELLDELLDELELELEDDELVVQGEQVNANVVIAVAVSPFPPQVAFTT